MDVTLEIGPVEWWNFYLRYKKLFSLSELPASKCTSITNGGTREGGGGRVGNLASFR